MTTGTRPLLRFLPWLLASAATHAVLLMQWPADPARDTETNSTGEGATRILSVQLLSARAPAASPQVSSPPAAAEPSAAAHPGQRPTLAPLSTSVRADVSTHDAQANLSPGARPDTRKGVSAAQRVITASAGDTGAESVSASATGTNESPALEGAAWTELMGLLHQAIDRTKRYPLSALRLGREGSARIDFRLGPDGRIEDLSIDNSSGIHALDVAAYRAVQDIAPFPEAHRYLERAQRFQVDVVFRIN